MNTFLDCIEWVVNLGPNTLYGSIPVRRKNDKTEVMIRTRYQWAFGKTKRQCLVTPEITGNQDIVPYWANIDWIGSFMEDFDLESVGE